MSNWRELFLKFERWNGNKLERQFYFGTEFAYKWVEWLDQLNDCSVLRLAGDAKSNWVLPLKYKVSI